MSKVQVDGSCLPPVQEVCRDFAVLEDGALAYCLQEQEIEQHYTSNVQKNQLVQKDIQVAKVLQDLEDGAIQPKQSEVHDLEPAQTVQGKMQRKGEETRWRKEQGQEVAKGPQEWEVQGSGWQRQRRGNSSGTKDHGRAGRLDRQAAELEPQSRQQLQRDEELAWKLQQEDQARLRARKKNQERNDDFRVAQVAQDEEIARYLQEQELKAQWAPPDKDWPATAALGQHRSPQKVEQKSFAAAPQISVRPLESPSECTRGGHQGTRPQPCRNIAEDLDPTFRTRKPNLPARVSAVCSPAAAPVHPVLVDSSFDYPSEGAESTLVSPSKQHPGKTGRRKPREKREGCKQQ
uniref:Coiled-coil domain-containing protein n=1 Tax=Salvator merianae TaxID=96440 RepID=A0A8D0DW79_SALMN